MIAERGKVSSLSGRFAIVSVRRDDSCLACPAKTACGTSAIGSFLGQRHGSIKILNTIGAKPGDRVVVSIPQAGLVKLALLVYGAPLLAMLLGAVSMDAWFDDELIAAMGGIAGLLVGFVVVSRYARTLHDSPTFGPTITAQSDDSVIALFDD